MRRAGYVMCLALLRQISAAQSYDDLFRQGSELSDRREYAQAIERFEAALKLKPGAPEALSNLGVMYHMAGRYTDAVDTMKLVVKLNPGLFPARLILGLDLVRLNRAADAVPQFEAALKLSPGNRDALLGLAAARVALKQLEEAAALYDSRTRSAPADVEAWYGLGLCYERLAEAASRRLSRTPGGTALDKEFLREFLLDRGEIRLADEALRDAAALRHEPPSAEAKAAYDEAHRLATRSRGAFLKLVEAAPDAWQSQLFLGDLNRQQRHFPDAIANYEAVELAQPESPAPKLGLATVYWETGDFDKSETFLRRVLELNPKSPQALFQLGNICVRQRREQEAIQYLTAFLELEPDSLAACADLGKAHFHLGHDREALIYLTKARQVDDRGDIHYQLATVLRRLNRTAEADAALRVSKVLRERELARQQRLRGNAHRE